MIIERLASEALEDSYFKDLYVKVSRGVTQKFFDSTKADLLTENDIIDLLRFADILSNSSAINARNKAFEIVSLLNEINSVDKFYKTFSHSVLSKLGNFPGLDYLEKRNNNYSQLPVEKQVEEEVKRFRQAVPFSDGQVFTDAQFELFTRLSDSKVFSFSGPTSVGKSFIIKSFIRRAVTNIPPDNIVIMVPTRALINQFSVELKQELKDLLEKMNYKVATNSNISELPNLKGQRFIFVLTAERLVSLLSQKESPPIGYLFVDEAHKIAAEKDPRSITAYTAISKALYKNNNLNLYFASPNVSNPEVFLKLFDKDVEKSYKTNEAAVSQSLFFIDLFLKEAFVYVDNQPVKFSSALIEGTGTSYDLIMRIGTGHSNLIYCSSKYQAIQKAKSLFDIGQQDEQISRKRQKAIRQIKTYIHRDYYLAEYLKAGIGYHFGTLPQAMRSLVESLFREGEIHFLMCTSTLLEGVNLPAKNVFILNNKNGRELFKPIDFWNLAGRAGRLKYELSGNIICIRETEKEWKDQSKVLESRGNIVLTPTVFSYLDNKSKLKKIEEILNENPNVKFETEYLREILQYIANIISIDVLKDEKYDFKSEIIKKFIKENRQDLIALVQAQNSGTQVPLNVLDANQSVKVQIQDSIFKTLKASKNKASITLPNVVDYEACKVWLLKFYDLFQWANYAQAIFSAKETEKQKKQINYYALLMTKWINGEPLSLIIDGTLDYFRDKNVKVRIDFNKYEEYNGSVEHVNIIINELIDDIENVLRFQFEKYFNNYYAILIEVLGDDNAGSNWATFLEYGSQNSIVIGLQNLGLSRHTANYLYNRHRSCLIVENNKLVDIDLIRLRRQLPEDDVEFDEIIALFF